MKTLATIFFCNFLFIFTAYAAPAFQFEHLQSGMTLNEVAKVLHVPQYNANKILSRGLGIKPLKTKGLFKGYSFSKIDFDFTEDHHLYRIILRYDKPNGELKTRGFIQALMSKYPSAQIQHKNDLLVIFEDQHIIDRYVKQYAEMYLDQL